MYLNFYSLWAYISFLLFKLISLYKSSVTIVLLKMSNRLGVVTYKYEGIVYKATIKTANFILSHDGILFNRVSVWIKHIKTLHNKMYEIDDTIKVNPITNDTITKDTITNDTITFNNPLHNSSLFLLSSPEIIMLKFLAFATTPSNDLSFDSTILNHKHSTCTDKDLPKSTQ